MSPCATRRTEASSSATGLLLPTSPSTPAARAATASADPRVGRVDHHARTRAALLESLADGETVPAREVVVDDHDVSRLLVERVPQGIFGPHEGNRLKIGCTLGQSLQAGEHRRVVIEHGETDHRQG
jgi:hypothetical protein